MNDRMTASDIKKIEEEIEYRKVTLRPKLLEDLKEARAQGDLSENFEYYAAKRANNKNNSRIRYLERMIGTAQIIEDDSKDDEVGINNWVTIYIEEDDAEETYKIVTPIRANSLKGFISIESPLGKALLKHKVGDKVEVKVNDSYSYIAEIRDLDSSTDDSEDEISSY